MGSKRTAALAVPKVTSNREGKTPGTDGVKSDISKGQVGKYLGFISIRRKDINGTGEKNQNEP